jgi:hypothetical protein
MTAGAQTVMVRHEAPRCLPNRCVSPKLVAQIVSPERVDSVAVYFRAQGEGEQYYTMMRPSTEDAETFWGYLPVVEGSEVEFVEYYVEAVDWTGVTSRSEVFRVEVSDGCDVDEMTEEDERFARNLVVGLTKPSQDPIPPGFRCAGIVASLTAGGDLRPNEECRRRRAENGDDSGCPIAWIKPTAIIVGAAATVGVLVTDDDGEPQVPLSVARP